MNKFRQINSPKSLLMRRNFVYFGQKISEGQVFKSRTQVKYTMASDVAHTITKAYGILHSEETGVALRAAFLIDKQGVVKSQIINDLPFGRNIDEILRTFDAMQFFEKHGEVCPAGWKKGDRAMIASPEGVAGFLKEHVDQL